MYCMWCQVTKCRVSVRIHQKRHSSYELQPKPGGSHAYEEKPKRNEAKRTKTNPKQRKEKNSARCYGGVIICRKTTDRHAKNDSSRPKVRHAGNIAARASSLLLAVQLSPLTTIHHTTALYKYEDKPVKQRSNASHRGHCNIEITHALVVQPPRHPIPMHLWVSAQCKTRVGTALYLFCMPTRPHKPDQLYKTLHRRNSTSLSSTGATVRWY